MNHIPERKPAFDRDPSTYMCNCFTLHPIIFNEDLQMETAIKEIEINDTNLTLNRHSVFHLYLSLLGHIDFHNWFSFPAPVYAFPMPTMALEHALTTDKLLDHPMMASTHEPSDDKLLETPNFHLNIMKIPANVVTSSGTSLSAAAELMVLMTTINGFLKLTLDHISTLVPVFTEMTMPLHQPEMYVVGEVTVTLDKILTNIPEETTIHTETVMDVVPPKSAVGPSIYLARPLTLASPLMITTVATARYIPPIRFSQQFVSDSQWFALAAALKAYGSPPPPPCMLFPGHHWGDYPTALRDQITEILIPALVIATAVPQQMPSVPMAWIVAQSVPQSVSGQPPLTVWMDVQQQQLSTSTAQLDRHSQPIQKPTRYEHSVKCKMQ
uniref:Uncharacterized protein n=1 Tax=Romanomermis culicivorax TaxID=13658 RepID=A0A915IVR9_ROMCU